MGVLNLTPDSFSDGGQHLDPDRALAAALKMAAQGADLIDLGAQSTRPGAQQLGSEAELARLLPVLQRLGAAKARGAFPQAPLLSVDTFHAPVAAAALGAVVPATVGAVTRLAVAGAAVSCPGSWVAWAVL